MESAILEAAVAKPSLTALKNFARSIYPHWRDRRLKRGGKGIIPQLDVSHILQARSFSESDLILLFYIFSSMTNPTNQIHMFVSEDEN